MKIAAITITYNDGYKFKEWCEHYEEYKEALALHIIVDNASDPEYLQSVKSYFSNSIIIERDTNGGCTGAYNDGIRKALEDNDIDSIMLIGNDIRISTKDIYSLYNFLYSKPEYGMVSPVMVTPGTRKIECFGSKLNIWGVDEFPYVGSDLDDKEVPEFREVEYVTGGMNLSKREFYENVGLQDEKLFMYADELDMYCRAKKASYKEAVTKNAIAYHCHINPQHASIRRPEMYYLHGRNIVYLYKKHYKFSWFFKFLIRFVLLTTPFLLHPFNKDQRTIFKYHCKGFYSGIKGNMDNSFMQS